MVKNRNKTHVLFIRDFSKTYCKSSIFVFETQWIKRNMLVYVYNVLIEHNKLSHIEDLTRKNTSPETHFVFVVFTIIHVRSIA